MSTPDPLARALAHTRQELLRARDERGVWTGELAGSAVATAAAVCAHTLVERAKGHAGPSVDTPAGRGLAWLAANANPDGGWGDTVLSPSNAGATALAWAAFGIMPHREARFADTVQRARDWLQRQPGGLGPGPLAAAIVHCHGDDGARAGPVLLACALTGCFGSGATAWKGVPPLPFARTALPARLVATFGRDVPRHLAPGLIAIGHARSHLSPTANPLRRALHGWARSQAPGLLAATQPASGGFLESVPLTSGIAMSLAVTGHVAHPVVAKAVEFLARTARADGCWPIHANLTPWVTALAVNALAAEAGPVGLARFLAEPERRALTDWLLKQQGPTRDTDTPAATAGWGRTSPAGDFADAESTAGALLALLNLDTLDSPVRASAARAARWLLAVQTADGGIATLQQDHRRARFDRSSPELTAHAVRALIAWRSEWTVDLRPAVQTAIARAVEHLAHTQKPDGTWTPLWLGNPSTPGEINPTCGTAQVLTALGALSAEEALRLELPILRSARWLQNAQRRDGSWSGGETGPPSIEETALATEALAALAAAPVATDATRRAAGRAVNRGLEWLLDMVRNDAWKEPSAIGRYLSRHWYYERLYPQIFTVAALGRALHARQLHYA